MSMANRLREGLGGDVDYFFVDVELLELKVFCGFLGLYVKFMIDVFGLDGFWDFMFCYCD